LHNNCGIAHRDIKPENFLFEKKGDDCLDIKMIDFGLSKVLNNQVKVDPNDKNSKRNRMIEMGTMSSKAGTPAYVSPEVIAGNYNLDCDMWAAGCVLYVMIAGYPPFYGSNEIELASNIQKGIISFDGDEWKNSSRDVVNLINKLINKPSKRLSAEEALNHKWFKKIHKGEEVKEV
jgi:calcium-dependent protein kinase|tara:strand:- start:441 stop:968 length:528 start_codon:yes stop_codon:yes gene_type:complete